MKGRVLGIAIVLCASGMATGQQETGPGFSLGGYVKNMTQFSYFNPPKAWFWSNLLHNRLNLKYHSGKGLEARLELRNRIFYGDLGTTIPFFAESLSSDPGWMDLSWNLAHSGNLLANSTIDRASLRYVRGNWDVTLGRQRINWGKNLVWNPNDLFNSYNFLDFDYEERPGSDAIRVQYFTGDFSKIEITGSIAQAGRRGILAALYGFHKGAYDMQALAGVYEDDLALGGGWAGNLSGAGFKGEFTYFRPIRNKGGRLETFVTSLTLDYVLPDNWYLQGSVLYISHLPQDPLGPEILSLQRITAKTLMPFHNSFLAQVSREFTPAYRAGLTTVYAPSGHSMILVPTCVYTLSENWEIDFTGQGFFEFETGRTGAISWYFRLRWSF